MVEPGGLVLGRAKEGVAYLVGVGIRAEVKGLGLGYGYGLGSRSRVQGTGHKVRARVEGVAHELQLLEQLRPELVGALAGVPAHVRWGCSLWRTAL